MPTLACSDIRLVVIMRCRVEHDVRASIVALSCELFAVRLRVSAFKCSGLDRFAN